MSQVFDKVKDVIAKELEVDEAQVKMESLIIDDLGADSLDVVELIMALEDEFELEIPTEEAEKIFSVADAVKYIEAALN
ncbi:MAG: acyl carrier protein [Acidobacteria bacterium]|nr:MAG: acyl carrier protein [Acidobacteriota bacterium]PIE91010.1 MAG: acyl carrier protein [Acidobacteriota bacterium]